MYKYLLSVALLSSLTAVASQEEKEWDKAFIEKDPQACMTETPPKPNK